jgi:hypothetical protein
MTLVLDWSVLSGSVKNYNKITAHENHCLTVLCQNQTVLCQNAIIAAIQSTGTIGSVKQVYGEENLQ